EWAAEERPTLATPAATLFARAGLRPPPVTVREARDRLRAGGLLPAEVEPAGGRATSEQRRWRGVGRRRPPAALEFRGVWHELRDGPAILRGLDLRVEPGERVVIMGRNGAGKSTLLRHARGLLEPTRGRVERGGEVA